ncbi:hypothetical protein PENFLA_c087G04890 [Penicillium flavigenum]|uniref:Uncharacterized protein n=1 Tax=Penicillium flavigenum TaxID=254877 RepID=A0A1V6S986_9EURO|nr:hypothetical protein PENFLA_c087G04890 [Penicillium flavigenum]
MRESCFAAVAALLTRTSVEQSRAILRDAPVTEGWMGENKSLVGLKIAIVRTRVMQY